MDNARPLDSRLRSLLDQQGPFLSLYLNTEGARERAPEEIALRWRGSRDKAASAGAPEQLLAQVDDVVARAHRRGDGLVLFGVGDLVHDRRHLRSSVGDLVRYGPLPHLVPLVEWEQDNPRYAVVVADRTGAQIYVMEALDVEAEHEFEGDQEPIRKVQPGGWSQRRFQQRAEDSWENNAKEVAIEVNRIFDRDVMDFVVLAGDVRAVQLLSEHLGQDISSVTFEIDSQPAVALEEIEDELRKTIAAHVAHGIEATLDKFREERGQHDLAVEGVAETLKALQMAQVQTLLLSRALSGDDVWYSVGDATQAGSDEHMLRDLGLDDVRRAPVEDVLVRVATATGADIKVIPELTDEHGPRDGVGGLLRFSTQQA